MNKKLIMPVLAMLAFFPVFGQGQLPSDSLLRREAARMLMVGFRGDCIDDNSDAARYVRDLHVGSIVLFDVDLTSDGPRKIGTRNITTKERLIKLTHQLQGYADEPRPRGWNGVPSQAPIWFPTHGKCSISRHSRQP